MGCLSSANAVSVHLAPKGSGVELRWPWQLSLPYSGSSFFGSLFHKGVAAGSTEAAAATTAETRVRPDEGCLKYSELFHRAELGIRFSKRGQSVSLG